jgi:hypothetical protein
MALERVFLESLDWLRTQYGSYRFFAERDLVWTLQEDLRGRLARAGLPSLVFNDFPMLKGNRRALSADIALVDPHGHVALAAEFKYEPDHRRGGPHAEIWPTKLQPSVVFWDTEGVLKDVQRIREFVDQGRTPVAYSIFVDEGGHFRHRSPHPGTEWQDWDCGGARPRRVSVLLGVHRKA